MPQEASRRLEALGTHPWRRAPLRGAGTGTGGQSPPRCGSALQEEVVIDLEGLCELLGPLLPDAPLAVFHLGDVALRNAGQLGKLDLAQVFLTAGGTEHAAWPLGFGDGRERLTPGHRLTRLCFRKA